MHKTFQKFIVFAVLLSGIAGTFLAAGCSQPEKPAESAGYYQGEMQKKAPVQNKPTGGGGKARARDL